MTTAFLGGWHVIGHAACWHQPHAQMDAGRIGLRTWAPGAFAEQLVAGEPIDLLINHDPHQYLASTRDGTLRLFEDEYGLQMWAQLPDNAMGRLALEAFRSGRVTGVSLGHVDHSRAHRYNFINGAAVPEYMLIYATSPIREVSLCVWPAFPKVRGTWARLNDEQARAMLREQLRTCEEYAAERRQA